MYCKELMHLEAELEVILEEIEKLASEVGTKVVELTDLQNQRDTLEKLLKKAGK